jgi:hypothetical protein
MAKFLQAVEDCDKRERAIPYEHCVVHDHRTGCIVGAIKERNPAFSPSSDFGSGKPEYVYTRVYDWECPAGVVPPRKNDFYFESFYSAPLDCDADKSLSPLKQNPLLHLGERPATPPVTETAPN